MRVRAFPWFDAMYVSTSYEVRSRICVNFHRMPNSSKTQIWSNLIQYVFSLNPNISAYQFSAGKHMSPRCFFHIVVQIFFLHVSPCLLISCCWRHGVVMLTHRDFSLSHFLSKDALDGPSRISWNQMRLHHHCCSLLSAWFHREQTCGTCTSETRGARAPAHDGLTLW